MLVGTIAVETSEYLSELLTRKGITHNVLNAKEHAREAEIIKDAGQPARSRSRRTWRAAASTSSSATACARLGGLYVLATERHEARRIDNQLRGRSGRQGDPGETRFYLSGEDDLVRLFAGDRIKGIMERFKIPEDQPMEAKILSRQIEGAQKKVEEQNFVMRKNVLKYDDVLNRHRGRSTSSAAQVLEGDDLSEQVKLWIDEVVEDTVNCSPRTSTPSSGISRRSRRRWRSSTRPRSRPRSCARTSGDHREALIEEFQTDARDEYEAKEEELEASRRG